MANNTKPIAKPAFDPKKLSAQEQDLLDLSIDALVKKYGWNKKAAIDRRYGLRKKFAKAGLTPPSPGAAKPKQAPKPAAAVTKKASLTKPPQAAKPAATQTKPVTNSVPVEQKKIIPAKKLVGQDIELYVNGILLKLNFFPKKVSVDPDQKAIEVSI